MRKLIFIVLILAMTGLAGCTTDQERAVAADADFKEERLKILQNYQKCVDEAKQDEAKLKACEHYLKAIDAMK
jgi:hypothetical protein